MDMSARDQEEAIDSGVDTSRASPNENPHLELTAKKSFLHNSGYGIVHFAEEDDNSIVVLTRNGSIRASIRVQKPAKTTNEALFAIKLSKKASPRQSKRKGKKDGKKKNHQKSKTKEDAKEDVKVVSEIREEKQKNVQKSKSDAKEDAKDDVIVLSEIKLENVREVPSVPDVINDVKSREKPKVAKPSFPIRSGVRRSVRRHGSIRKPKHDESRNPKTETKNRRPSIDTRIDNLPALTERDEGVYGSVKSLVKQAIRNFERLDSAAKAEQINFAQSRSKSIPTSQCERSRAQPTLSLPTNPQPQINTVEVEAKPVLVIRDEPVGESSDYERNAERLYSNTEEIAYANCGPFREAITPKPIEPKQNLKPNSSFLWSGKSRQIYQDIYLTLSESRPPYDEIGSVAPRSSDSSSNYDDIKSLPSVGYDDVKPPSVGYDDIKAPSVSYDDLKQNYEEARLCTTYYNASQAPSVRYDDIRSVRRRSCMYDDLRPPSSNGYIEPSLVVNTSPSSLVKAMPAIVMEDQIDSISYFYDDIAGAQRTYERIRQVEQAIDSSQKDKEQSEPPYEDDCEELFTYRLPKPPKIGVPDSPAPSITCSRSVTERRSETSDEWMDVSDVEMEEGVSTDLSPPQGKFVRDKRTRSTRRGSRALPKKAGKSWTRAFRGIFKFSSSKSPDYESVRSVRRQPSTSSAASSYSTLNLREGESESEVIQEEPANHYETLYEVINSNLSAVPDHVSDDFEDSFESEDDITRDVSQDNLSQKSRDSGNASSYGLSKITEVANKKMRHFRHHLTSRKKDFRSEISNTFSRIRKTTAASSMDLADLFRRNPNGESEDIASKSVSDLNLDETRLSETLKTSDEGRKGTWKIPNLKKRNSKKDSVSTFYLTLTLDPDDKNDSGYFNKDDSDSLPSIGSCKSLSGTSPNSSTAKTPIAIKGRRTSSAYDIVRPTTAPPPPPPVAKDEDGPPSYAPPPPPVDDGGEKDAPPSYPPPSVPEMKWTIGAVKVMNLSAKDCILPKRESSLSDLAHSIASELKNRMEGVERGNSRESSESSDLVDDEYKTSQFSSEPLYQFYTASILDRAILEDEDSEEDDYEVIRPTDDGLECVSSIDKEKLHLPQRLSAMELVEPCDGTRTLWCQLPAVVSSGILNRLSVQAKKKQEAMFEVITSEASYLRSLNVLINHFMNSPELNGESSLSVISKRDRHLLFSDLVPVQQCSERFLADLEKRWQENIVIRDICDIILSHAEKYFDVYVKYCSHQLYQERTLKELKESNPVFTEVLKRLESDPVCQSLSMHSFLMLPMQRITRLPLLVDAIYRRMEFNCLEFETCKMALATLSKIVQDCNEGARKMERYEEMLVISRQLEFKDVKAVPLISSARWLVKRGEFTRISWKEGVETKLTFGRKINKTTVSLYLFTDLVLVAKKKGDDCYHVIDYCLRNMAQLTDLDPDQVLAKGESGKNLLLLTMLQNYENKTNEIILQCNLESDRTRWLEAMTPKTSDNPDEVIYEEWDCPQVQVIHPYTAQQNDELSLQVADVVNVLRKMADGWYEGERIRDRERGWFPGNYTQEIASIHVRAKNLKQRWRLLALSGSFLARQQEEQSKRRSRVF